MMPMMHMRHYLSCLCVAVASAGVLAQGTDEHKDHHPADTAAPAPAAAPTTARQAPAQATGTDNMAAMDRHMRAMQAMHEKMVAAKTPQERQALMAEHMQTMQDGMRMMESMRGQMTSGKAPGSPPSGMAGMMGMGHDPQMMEKRMAMMEAMIQMMVDRMSMPSATPPGAK